MKYYKKHLHIALKDVYFKHFGYMQMQKEVISGTFDEEILYKIKPNQGTSLTVINEFKKLIEDYLNIEKGSFVPNSNVMQEIKNTVNVANDIANYMLRFNTCPIIREVIRILRRSPNSCLVGGAVRDIINSMDPKDFDFVTEIPYDILQKVFVDEGFTVKETGKKFLVLNVIKDGVNVEIANFRKDGTYTDGRRPDETSIGTIEDDAARRDFTINALYYNLQKEVIIDPTGDGLLDHAKHYLTFVGKPKARLDEDLLRIFRFYRFLNKGMMPDAASLIACRDRFEDAIKTVSPDRIRMEIEKMVL